MALSLQVKKFINSEHTGSYAEIRLPLDEPAKKRAPRREETEEEGELSAGAGGAQAAEEPQGEAVRLHYFEEGSGEPLILVHTVGQSLYTWRAVFNRLSEHYRVILLDLPGHGYSDRPSSFDYTIEDFAMALRLFMDALGIESAHFVGFSMAASYVMQLAVEHPERCGRLVLLAPGGVVNEMPLSIRMMDSPIFGGLASALYSRGTVRKILEECFFDLTNVKDDMIDEYYRPVSNPEARRAVRYSLYRFDNSGLINRLREISLPVLILQGNEDKWRTEEQVEHIHVALPEAGFAVVRNAGHLMHEEKPERLVSALLEFIPIAMPE